ncbi:hypothetical protein PENANT_c189G04525 [Penicillium antarcticum]|uniref:Uncharacterized protein n=1 Tax=Penicillium antarcticum TaxID=416450 RepID=A0A1V6PBH1_9EURO|nr:hypothetical protein PENANT_c189G04525 [Penicillium antarcticum]
MKALKSSNAVSTSFKSLQRLSTRQYSGHNLRNWFLGRDATEKCPSLASGIQSFRGHGYRCHEPGDASQGGAASTRLPRRLGLCQQQSSQGGAA